MTQATINTFGTPVETSGTTVNIPLPAGVVADKGVLAFVFVDGAPRALTWPAGWQEPENSPVDVSPNSHGLHVAWHRAPGSESGTVSPTWTAGTFVSAFTALVDDMVTSGDPFDSPTGSAMTGSNVSVSPTVSTTSLGPDRLLVHVATNWSGGTWTADTSPAFTKRQQGLENVIVLCTRDQPTAGGSGSVEATCTGTDKSTAWLGALIGTTTAGVTETTLPSGGSAGSGTQNATGTATTTTALPTFAIGLTGTQAATGSANITALAGFALGAGLLSIQSGTTIVSTLVGLLVGSGTFANASIAALQITIAGKAGALGGTQAIGTLVMSRGIMRPTSRQTPTMSPTTRSTASMGP